MTDTATARVVIVDDDPLVRQQVRLVLKHAPVEVVGEAADGADAVEAAKELAPDVVLMDLHMPVMTGIEATRAIVELGTGIHVIALTALGDDNSLLQMLSAGARGFVPKEYANEDLATAIHHVMCGDGYVSPHSQPQLFGQLARTHATEPRDAARAQLATLSPREREVADLVATGARNAEIARRLFVSESTVKSQLDSIRTKLEVPSREQIAVLVERAT